MKVSYILAGAAVIALGGWFALNNSGEGEDLYADLDTRGQAEAALPTVVTRMIAAQPHEIRLTAYGRTEPNRMVELKAKTPGPVVSTPIEQGTPVKRGDVVCRQDVDARRARVDQARALLKQVEGDLAATRTLVEKGFRSATQIAREEAAVDGARAELKSAQIELDNVVIRAPFSGIYEKRMAEVGDYLAPGQPCAMIVELDPLKVETELTETQVGLVTRGQAIEVRLATGQTVTGTVNFIESMANPATRTFQMETVLPNADMSLKAGVSATVNFATGDALASLVPSGVLTLDDTGTTGIRYVDRDNRVRFVATQQVDETAEGLWVTGLPETARVIIEGQDFVSVGTQVDPRSEASVASSGALAASEYE